MNPYSLKHLGLAVSLFHLATSSSLASIPSRQTELPIYQIQVVKPETGIRSEDVARIVPTHFMPGTDGGLIGRQILERSAQMILNGSALRESGVGRAATTIENAGKTDIGLGSSESGIKHNLNLEYRVFENLALFRYSGLVNANVRYSLGDRGYDIQIEDDLDEVTQLVFSHHTLTATSQVRVSWQF